MKDWNLLVWLSQLGLNVAVPPAVFLWLAVWVCNRFGWGQWVIWVAAGLGLYCAITGFVSSLRTLTRLTKRKEPENNTVSFNEHE